MVEVWPCLRMKRPTLISSAKTISTSERQIWRILFGCMSMWQNDFNRFFVCLTNVNLFCIEIHCHLRMFRRSQMYFKVTVSPKWSGGPMLEKVELTFANKIVFRFWPSCSWKDKIKILCTTSCKQTNINTNIENALKIHKFCKIYVCINRKKKGT